MSISRSIFTVIRVGSAVIDWYESASSDGKITFEEVTNLLTRTVSESGVALDFEVQPVEMRATKPRQARKPRKPRQKRGESNET